MSYKIVRITNLNSEYLKQYRSYFPNIQDASFEEQYDHLVNDSFDTASSISNCLRDLGVEAINIFTNANELQNRWMEENNCDKSGKALLLEQIKSIQPEVVWIDNLSLIDTDWVVTVRQNVKSVRIITGLVCAPYNSIDLKTLEAFNFVVACTPGLVKEIERSGLESYLIYHGFDSEILKRITQRNYYPENDLVFTGSLITGGGFHKTRIEYLEKFLAKRIDVKIYGGIDSTSKILMKKMVYHSIKSLRRLGIEQMIRYVPVLNRYESYGDTPVKFYSSRLKNSLTQAVYGLEQFKLLSKAKICFNIHGEIAKGCAGNLRLFEATGLGTCLVTDWKENLSDLFELEKEVITYRSSDECIDKINWLLHNPLEAEMIGKAGQARTLSEHSIRKRADLINELLISKMK